MATAENAKLLYEAGRDATAMSALTDSGDHISFTSSATLFSRASGSEPDIRPNGLITGGAVSVAASGSDDVVDVAALTCYLAGVKTSVSADTDVSITRAATDVSKVNSITINSSGAVEVVAGTDGSDANFVETRGAAGGPPYIPETSIEIGQVRTTTSAAAAVTAAQIFQVIGLHQERYDFPVFTIDYANAEINFASALGAIHTGDVAKKVYGSYSDPIFAEISLASDFVPAETSHSVSSTQIYGSTLGSSSKTLNQSTFTAYLADGVTDDLVKNKNENLWFKFFPDRLKSPYILTQGKLGVGRTFPAGDNIQAACTISADSESVEVAV